VAGGPVEDTVFGRGDDRGAREPHGSPGGGEPRMKVVIFCGGLGTRLREYSETIPKPLVCVGYRPILWHIMRYYAHYGHRDFILCLGYKGTRSRSTSWSTTRPSPTTS
jgi:molybdopterin-guanine dinucleotide biosynthesis protein A